VPLFRADSDDNVQTFAYFLIEEWNVFRRVLQIAIHDHVPMGAGMIDTGRQGVMLSEIPTELKTANAPILPAKLLYERPGVIGAAVVHENDGEIIGNGWKRLDETLTKLPQDSLSFVDRYNDRNFIRRSVLYQASSGMGLIDGEHKIIEIPNEWSRSGAAWVFRFVKTKHGSQ
jgi:hypothetical protein